MQYEHKGVLFNVIVGAGGSLVMARENRRAEIVAAPNGFSGRLVKLG